MSGTWPIPRLLVGGTASGVGKTTVVVGLIGALRARGLRVAVFKCGPDYLDPTYHSRAAGSPCHNLDGWMMGKEAVLATFRRGAHGADIAIVEGVMGLFDGASPTSDEGSTAEIARWLQAPVLLVVDTRGMARTVAAIARGFSDFDRAVALRGIVCNRVGSRGHLDLLRRTEASPPIVGGLPVESRYAFPERHLGLHTADRQSVPDHIIQPWGPLVEEWLDLPAILELARAAPPLPEGEESPSARRGRNRRRRSPVDRGSGSPSTRRFTSTTRTTSPGSKRSGPSSSASRRSTTTAFPRSTDSTSVAGTPKPSRRSLPGTKR